MPELPENFYCSEQICIPPTFPYLLRQFAKAAIRSQPNDLLRWATTYFRCLSLNIPPPVKLRLEYPVPTCKATLLTPGWLKVLCRQFSSQETVNFRLLFDRWTGACLPYDELIKILCLGGFDDNQQIPIRRFLAVCCGLLTDNLTQTMILVCEIFTEEPEGGSAMITKLLFLDLYRFLAEIDACGKRTVRNYQFLEKFLDEAAVLISKEVKIEESIEEESEVTSEISIPKRPHEITAQDYLNIITESQTTIGRPLELGAGIPDTSTSCSLDEELQIIDDIQEYLEKIEKTAVMDEDQIRDHDIIDIRDDDDTMTQMEKQKDEESSTTPTIISKTDDKSDGTLSEIDEMLEFEEVELDPVPGIGPVVPEKLIKACCKYFDKMAELQNGMIMPRNIRHYDCPPLEIHIN